jgi:hypothetical protein
MDMRFGTWNVRSLYRSGALKTVSGELAKYKLDLVGVLGTRGCFRSIPEVLHENSVRRFQCKGGKGRYF